MNFGFKNKKNVCGSFLGVEYGKNNKKNIYVEFNI